MKRFAFAAMAVSLLYSQSFLQASEQRLLLSREARGEGESIKEASANLEASIKELAASCEAAEGRRLVELGKPKTSWDSTITSGFVQYTIYQNFACATQQQVSTQQARLSR